MLKPGTTVIAMGAFDKSFRTVLTGLTAICALVYSCQIGLRKQAFVYSLRTVLRRVRMVGVGTPTILTHKHPAWRIALAKFILSANLPLQRFYKTFTCPNVTLTLHCATYISIK